MASSWCAPTPPKGSSTTLLMLIERAPDDIARILARPRLRTAVRTFFFVGPEQKPGFDELPVYG